MPAAEAAAQEKYYASTEEVREFLFVVQKHCWFDAYDADSVRAEADLAKARRSSRISAEVAEIAEQNSALSAPGTRRSDPNQIGLASLLDETVEKMVSDHVEDVADVDRRTDLHLKFAAEEARALIIGCCEPSPNGSTIVPDARLFSKARYLVFSPNWAMTPGDFKDTVAQASKALGRKASFSEVARALRDNLETNTNYDIIPSVAVYEAAFTIEGKKVYLPDMCVQRTKDILSTETRAELRRVFYLNQLPGYPVVDPKAPGLDRFPVPKDPRHPSSRFYTTQPSEAAYRSGGDAAESLEFRRNLVANKLDTGFVYLKPPTDPETDPYATAIWLNNAASAATVSVALVNQDALRAYLFENPNTNMDIAQIIESGAVAARIAPPVAGQEAVRIVRSLAVDSSSWTPTGVGFKLEEYLDSFYRTLLKLPDDARPLPAIDEAGCMALRAIGVLLSPVPTLDAQAASTPVDTQAVAEARTAGRTAGYALRE